MTVLRLVSLVAIAGICVSIFAIVYPQLRGLSDAKEAEEAASTLSSQIQQVITTGNPENPSLFIPNGYVLKLENSNGKQKISVDGISLPEDGFSLNVKFENFSELPPGEHDLHIELENQQIIVQEVT
ncbi:MAG: hypothetical protein KGY45_01280 [Hadesarchaea archaeon]|nr:hypothetical protein [Hadesarchaea archaeon]